MVQSVSLTDEIPHGVAIGVRQEEDHLRDLMVRYQQADQAAVEELVRRLSPLLLRFFASPENNRADAEDLLQDCWIRIHRARHTYRSAEPLLPWIFAIARHARLDSRRRQCRRAAREVLVAETPERMEENSGRGTAVLELLDLLPESQRDVIVMLKVLGLSLEDVARATSSTVGSVKQKAHRTYVRLKQLLEEQK